LKRPILDDPILEDGVLRVGGRLSRAVMPEEMKHPIILAKDFHISDIILKCIHQEVGHGGGQLFAIKVASEIMDTRRQ